MTPAIMRGGGERTSCSPFLLRSSEVPSDAQSCFVRPLPCELTTEYASLCMQVLDS